MTDRELLEMAAKAAGVDFVWNDKETSGYWGDWRGLPQWNDWNPLTDDGDALRLAIDLRLDIYREWEGYKVEFVYATGMLQSAKEELTQEQSQRQIATRRAIVRAAAEIGRAIPTDAPAAKGGGA